MRNIDIVFLEDGSVHIRTRGFRGKQCLEEVEKILEALRAQGVEVRTESVRITEEGYESVSQRQKTLEA